MPLITEEELWDLLDFSYVTVRMKQPRAEPWDNLDTSNITVRKTIEPRVCKTIDLLEPRLRKPLQPPRVRKPLQEMDVSMFRQ